MTNQAVKDGAIVAECWTCCLECAKDGRDSAEYGHDPERVIPTPLTRNQVNKHRAAGHAVSEVRA